MQFSLFEKRPLFDSAILERRRAEWQRDPIPFERISKKIREFASAPRRAKSTEPALEQAFNQAFFIEYLGYQLFPGTADVWSAWPKPPRTELGLDGEPDLILGQKTPEGFDAVAVVELKRPGTPLDAPQVNYDNRTPVEQAFGYAQQLSTCQWVIVTDMKLLRLYSIDGADAYHEMDLVQDDLALRDCCYLLAHDRLVVGGPDSETARLLNQGRDKQIQFREGFYKLYAEIRDVLLSAIGQWSDGRYDRRTQVLAVQRLLDRLLFIYFCEDHPDRLLVENLVKDVTERAVKMPGGSQTKAYDQLKQLFRDLDGGVDTEYWKIPKYNGELFKHHPLVDELELPDSLHKKKFVWTSKRGLRKTIDGVYGLHQFDFWRELDRDLLGNLFERSIGDLEAIAHGGRPDARRAFGIYYTASRLARYVTTSAVTASLSENEALSAALTDVVRAPAGREESEIDRVVGILKEYRIADLSCGSGVFLTAALDTLLTPYRKALESVAAGGLAREMLSFRQSEILRSSIYGVDLLPQAVELAKLALWLTAARRNEPSADLSSNFLIGDSLSPDVHNELVRDKSRKKFDIILGNPPWGGEIDRRAAGDLLRALDFPFEGDWDSWEVFLALAFGMLRDGGRFALLVPDTIFSIEKRRTRRWLLEKCRLEKVFAMGPDWFTEQVRMGTVIIQGVKSAPFPDTTFRTMLLAGKNRREAQDGERPIAQLEPALARIASQARSMADQENRIQPLTSDEDHRLLAKIESVSTTLGQITDHGRGDELNAEGLVWRCGNCRAYMVPGEKEKRGSYAAKPCPNCGARVTQQDIAHEALTSERQDNHYVWQFIDGKALVHRYENPHRRFLRADLTPMFPPLKPADVFRGPKILIRQAGVGITATLVQDDVRCPQSVYLYRVINEGVAQGYSNEFLLACLASRTMSFIVMHRFGEIDPARAFSKLTHSRIVALPIPKLDRDALDFVRQIEADVRALLAGAPLGGEEDMRCEVLLREMWAITPDEGRYINGFFSALPDGQAVRDLFPGGAPTPIPPPLSLR